MLESDTKKKLANNANRSVLSLTSPTKLNVLSSTWKKQQSSCKILKSKPALNRTTSLTGFRPSGGSSNSKPRSSISSISLNSATKANSNNVSDSLFNRPKISLPPPLLLKRNSSFFKDEYPNSKSFSFSKTDSALDFTSSFSKSNPITVNDSSKIDNLSQDFEELSSNVVDRFFPVLQSNMQKKIDSESFQEKLPSPSASPVSHLKAQTKLVFKKTVAEACGLEMNQRVLQYMPAPPKPSFHRPTYSLKKRTHYQYQPHGNQDQQNNRISANLLKIRKINSTPDRILDAPGFQDDFYLNLLSWSSKNILAIALESSLYLWDGNSGEVSLLVDYNNIIITSVTWSDDDCHISIGKDDGSLEIWDIESMQLIRTMRSGLGVRIGSQSWLETLLATGSRSGEIQINDVRIKDHIISTWGQHKGEVCGLSYKSDGLQLASGGNDNTVVIWDTRKSAPQWIKRNHNAAVKAISWCPYTPNLLATGGGQTDKYIHFWNTINGNKIGSIETGSQVSSLHWGQSFNENNKDSNNNNLNSWNKEIVATGGAPRNSISIFNYDTKFKVGEIENAHESRICSSQISPDGTTIATVGGDENLKFYKIFDLRSSFMKERTTKSLLNDDLLYLFGNNNNDDAREKQVTLSNEFDTDEDDIEGDTNMNKASTKTTKRYIIR